MKIITVRFFKNSRHVEPVKAWLLALDKKDRTKVGQDIKTVEYGWPRGMPLVRKLDTGLWEVRTDLSSQKIARVIFTVIKSTMVLLHGFIKKSQKTPASDLNLAKKRRDQVLREEK